MFGQEMLQTLTDHGVNCEFIQVDEEAGSGVALVMVDDQGENIISVIPGTNMRITPVVVEAATGQIRAADVVMMQLEIPLDAIEKTIDLARANDTLSILNPAPACPLPDSILNKVDLLTPNQTEAKFLTGISADTVDGAEAAARALLDKGVKTVIITLGANGALIVQPDSTTHIESFKVDAFDTSGAGDAFMGGLGVALSEDKELEEAVQFANIVGALSATRGGAMPSMPTRIEVDDFARKKNLL
jgi:ribokinase